MLLDYQTLVMALVRDEGNRITLSDRDQAIARAVGRYSKDRPREIVEDLAASDATTLPLPSAWDDEASAIHSLEYPIGDVPPSYIEPDQFYLYKAPSVAKVIKVPAGLVAAATVRCAYTVPHTLSDATDTLPARDREAVTCWAAALLCDQLAALYANDSTSTIQADNVDHQSKSREYGARANRLRARYFDELGLDTKRTAPAAAIRNFDNFDSQGNDRLTHPRRYR